MNKANINQYPPLYLPEKADIYWLKIEPVPRLERYILSGKIVYSGSSSCKTFFFQYAFAFSQENESSLADNMPDTKMNRGI